jgi:hypothetical protein
LGWEPFSFARQPKPFGVPISKPVEHRL